MDYASLSNQQLVAECQKDPLDERAWKYFYDRFHKTISKYLYFWGRKLRIAASHPERMDIVSDAAQNVFMRLVANDRRLIRNFRNQTENSIYSYLALVAKSEMMNRKSYDNTEKRKADLVSFDKPIAQPGGNRDISQDESIPTQIHDLELKHRFDDRVEELLEKLNAVVFGRHKNRDILIFKLHVLKGLSPEEIFKIQGLQNAVDLSEEDADFDITDDDLLLLQDSSLSLKRIQNLISNIRKRLKELW